MPSEFALGVRGKGVFLAGKGECVACGLDRTETRSAKDAERGDGPHFADPVRNDVFPVFGSGLGFFAERGKADFLGLGDLDLLRDLAFFSTRKL